MGNCRQVNEHYKEKFLEKGLLKNCGGELQHLISDAATMQIIRWKDGGFGMAAHNYDGDMLTDEVFKCTARRVSSRRTSSERRPMGP